MFVEGTCARQKTMALRCKKHSMIAYGMPSNLKSALTERTPIHTEMEHDDFGKITMRDGFAEPQPVVWMQINYCAGAPLATAFVRMMIKQNWGTAVHPHSWWRMGSKIRKNLRLNWAPAGVRIEPTDVGIRQIKLCVLCFFFRSWPGCPGGGRIFRTTR